MIGCQPKNRQLTGGKLINIEWGTQNEQNSSMNNWNNKRDNCK